MTNYELFIAKSELYRLKAVYFNSIGNMNLRVFFHKCANDVMRKANLMTIEEAEAQV